MKKLVLKRFTRNPKYTAGSLVDAETKELICLTLELPWKDNLPNESCIYDFSYEIAPVMSPKFGLTYKLSDIEGRTDILFHKGNFTTDTKGCILVGQGYGEIDGKFAILQSGKAFEKFMAYMDGIDSAWLEVEWAI